MSTVLNPVFAAPARLETQIRDVPLFRRARTWWLLLALFLLTQENGLFTRQDDSYYSLRTLNQYYESSPVLLLLTCVMWTICAALMVNHMGPALRMMMKQKAVLAFVVLAYLSTAWSQVPFVTFRHATVLLLVVVFTWFFATYYSPADQMRLLLALGVIVALASIAMALLFPQYGIASGGEWKGVFAQKNRLGLGIVFLFAGLPFCGISNTRRLLTLAVQAILPIGVILLSQSKTSLILAVVLVAFRVIGPLAARVRKDQLPFLLYTAASGMLLVALAASVGRDAILSALGRDSTLTGRTEHWALLATFAVKHLWLGYGYDGFWTGVTGDSGRVIALVGSGIRGSDSGYVETMMQLGLVGLGMLLILLVVCGRNFARLFRGSSVPLIAFWYAGVIVITVVGSATEVLFPSQSGITPFLFVLACAGLTTLSEQSGLPS